MLTPLDKVNWKSVKYLKTPLEATDEEAKWEMTLVLPEPLASWDVFSYWESERYISMKKHLRANDILFDIGSEHGWLSIVYASLVKPENIVLIEPERLFWPNIKATWEKNYPGMKPKGFYDGLFSDKTTEQFLKKQVEDKINRWTSWPSVAYGDLIDRNKYQYIHENSENVPEMRLDDYVNNTGIVPDALTMDTEGSEYLILKGAEQTIKKYKPKLWISVHPDMALRDYGVKENELDDYLTGLGYKGEYIATDHEMHMYYDSL